MRGWGHAAIVALLVSFPAAAGAQEGAQESAQPPAQPPPKTADEEIEESRATLAESQAQAAPPLERGIPYKPSVMPWILGGVGLAAVVTGGVFFLVSLSDQSKADDFEKLATIRTDANEKNDLLVQAKKSEDNARSNRTIGLVAGGAGVALIGTAIVWALLDTPPKDPKAARVRPFVTPGSAGGTLSYVF